MRTLAIPAAAILATAAVLCPASAGAVRDRALPRPERAPRPASPGRPFPSRVRFEPNLGQWDARIRFLGRGPDCQVMLADGEAIFRLGGPDATPPRGTLVVD